MAVLIDSSVWIAASKVTNKECLQLKRLILERETIYVTDLIRLEVSQGARTEKEFLKLWESFLGFQCIEMNEHDLYLSAINYQKLRRKGLTVSTVGCLIATIAAVNRLPLWSVDKIFSSIAPALDLVRYKP